MNTKHWVFTLNNWTAADEDKLIALAPFVDYLVFGYEVGESGTPHLQGYVVFKTVKRLANVKAEVGARAHCEGKRGSSEAASTYCKKDGLYKEFGVLPKQGSGGQFATFVEWIMSESGGKGSVPSDRAIAQAYPALWVRYGRKLSELARHHCPLPVLVTNTRLTEWQRNLEQSLKDDPPDDRSIIFYVDAIGGCGKSYFQRYMISKYPEKVQLLGVGKRDDVAHAVDVHASIFLFNVPRGGMDYMNYNTLEMIKDRMVFSPKYDSQIKILDKNPHVIVFCNEEPDTSKMTPDRFIVIRDLPYFEPLEVYEPQVVTIDESSEDEI